jgi:hypothetical protein
MTGKLNYRQTQELTEEYAWDALCEVFSNCPLDDDSDSCFDMVVDCRCMGTSTTEYKFWVDAIENNACIPEDWLTCVYRRGLGVIGDGAWFCLVAFAIDDNGQSILDGDNNGISDRYHVTLVRPDTNDRLYGVEIQSGIYNAKRHTFTRSK